MNFKNITAIILAGGRGSRINKITSKKSKVLIKFNKKTLLTLIINNLSKYNFKEIIILAGYKGYQIKKKYHSKYFNLTKVICFIEKKRLGTWGAVHNYKKNIKNNFILVNGDTIFNGDLKKFSKFNLQKEKIAIFLTNNHKYKENKKLNKININKKNYIIYSKTSKYINSGTYYISKKIFKYSNKKIKSIENDLIPFLIKKNKIKGIIENKTLIDVGTNKNLKFANKNIKKILKKPAVFFDRDGVVNYDYGYVHKFKDFKFRPGILKSLKYLSQKKVYIFIVTNQAGIGKKIFKEKDFYTLHKKIKDFLVQKNIFINDVIFSPFHPKAKIKKYKKNSLFRKPGNLMIEKLFSNWELDRRRSFMIGDTKKDQAAAKKSKIYFEYPNKNIFNQITGICKKLGINNY
jgi:D-glycero-D-manno-heptose 1,7-bisphosphate phosphatase